MSKKQSKKKPDFSGHVQPRAAAEEHAEPKKKNTALLLGLAIFCLLIFTVTGPMTAVFRQLMAPSEGNVATLVLPSGEAAITIDDYREANALMKAQARLMGRRGNASEDEVLAYATLRKLAEELEVFVPDQELQGSIRMMLQMNQMGPEQYRQFWRGQGYGSAFAFEENLRNLLRVGMVERLLASGAGVITDADAIEQWEEDYEEIRLEFLSFRSEDFAEAAAALEPTEEELAAFFPDSLSYQQKNELEVEEQLAFDALVVSAEALMTDAVKAWASQDEPSEDDLSGFYDMRKFELYLRDPGDPDYDLNPTLPLEDIRALVIEHYRLNDAALRLAAELTADTDLEAYAAEKGVELIRYPEPVAASELPELPRIGNAGLRQLIFGATPVNEWDGRALVGEGLAYIARPTQQIQRALPELAEIRDSVVDYWREQRQGELAAEAAEAFVAGLPKGEDHVEGDPVNLDGEAFGAVAAASGRVIEVQDWIARRVRPAADPKWDTEEKIRPWLRNQVGQQLDTVFDGDVLGPLDNSFAQAQVVVRLVGRRAPDSSKIWPGELTSARRMAQSQALQSFRTEQLSYEGLAQSYQIEKVVPEVEGEG